MTTVTGSTSTGKPDTSQHLIWTLCVQKHFNYKNHIPGQFLHM